MEFKGILRERALWLKIAVVLAAGFMIYLSLMGKQYTYAAISVFVIFAVFLEKEHVISEKGVDIRYNVLGWKSVNRWEWSEITALKTDYQKKAPNVLLHIGKDVVIRDFVMKRSDIDGVVKLAKKMNPEIFIGHLSEEERERRDEEVLRQQDIQRARKAKQKRKK